MDNNYKLSDASFKQMLNSLDDTGGFLIKEREFRYWVEYFVNSDRYNAMQRRTEKLTAVLEGRSEATLWGGG